MTQQSYRVNAIEPPRTPRETLPTMYDLPSESAEDSGLPDEFHDLQPQLLSTTLRIGTPAKDQIFTGTDLNLYYDVRHPLWFKRPDWFLVVGVPRLYDGIDLRSSYVIWQEGVSPFVVVELVSPGTEGEDLGESANAAAINQTALNLAGDVVRQGGNEPPTQAIPPAKWVVYEQILRVPYYFVFSRYTNQLRFFQLVGGRYQEPAIAADQPRIWIPELAIGLGVWTGAFEGVDRAWLRWYDSQGNWIPTDAERATQAEAQLRQVALNLVHQGMTWEQVAEITGFSVAQIQTWATPIE